MISAARMTASTAASAISVLELRSRRASGPVSGSPVRGGSEGAAGTGGGPLEPPSACGSGVPCVGPASTPSRGPLAGGALDGLTPPNGGFDEDPAPGEPAGFSG